VIVVEPVALSVMKRFKRCGQNTSVLVSRLTAVAPEPPNKGRPERLGFRRPGELVSLGHYTHEVKMRKLVGTAVSVLMLAAVVEVWGQIPQTAPVLPAPTGSFRVGRIAYHWTDSSRAEPLSLMEGARREIMVHVWYPAAKPTTIRQTAPYIDAFAAVSNAVPREALVGLFRPAAYAAIERSLPETHAVADAAMPSSRERYPVLLFSHGLGIPTALYTAAIEDLVSYGYVVAAIDHTYDTGFTVFPGDRVVLYARQAWQTESQKPNGYVNYVKKRIEETWVPDIRFVLERLSRLDGDASLSAPFYRRLDLEHIGAFGHSMGGLAAVRACQLEVRILGCINQDADIAGSPFIVPSTGDGLRQPLLFFTAATANVFKDSFVRPTDEDLTRMNTTRSKYDADVARVQGNQNAALASVRGGSYRVLIDIPSFTHRTFSDLTLLAANDDPQRDESLANFRTAQSFTRAFFDKYLKGHEAALLDRSSSQNTRVRVDQWKGRIVDER
jgi:predicted dienelactone hydrolase